MAEYQVRVAIGGYEIYYVTADSEEQARDIWSDDDPDISEIEEAEVTSVTEIGEAF